MAPSERTSYYELDEAVVKKVVEDEDDIFDSDDDVVLRYCKIDYGYNKIVRFSRTKFWQSKSILPRFVGACLLDLLDGCENHWKRFDQLFDCISAFASCGHEEAIFLIR